MSSESPKRRFFARLVRNWVITRNADLYLPVRPGTDVILLMSLLHVILRDGLEDREFIEKCTSGFEPVAEAVRQYDPKRAAESTGVPPDSIEKAAHWFGEAERAIALHARGIEHQSKGVENCSAIINLCLATGNVGREGAGCAMITGQGNTCGKQSHEIILSCRPPVALARRVFHSHRR